MLVIVEGVLLNNQSITKLNIIVSVRMFFFTHFVFTTRLHCLVFGWFGFNFYSDYFLNIDTRFRRCLISDH